MSIIEKGPYMLLNLRGVAEKNAIFDLISKVNYFCVF